MTWHLRGDAYACCSCSVGCPCAVGELETAGSVGCSAVQIVEVSSGEVQVTNLAGAKFAAVVDWPGAMMAGAGTGRLYFDVGTTPEQRAALEALLSGKLGGAFARIPELVPTVLPPKVAPITLAPERDCMAIVVGAYGEAVFKPLAGGGEERRIRGAGGFRDDVALAVGTGSFWRDPELRQWEGGGYAEQSEFDWRS